MTTLNLNLTINLQTADFDQLDNHLLAISTHLAQLINATDGDPQAIINFITTNLNQQLTFGK